jgi:hypothetical protein
MQQVINWSIASGGIAVALLFQLIEKNFPAWAILGLGWFTIMLLGVLGMSQYAGEAGRVIRAAYYGRLIEAYASHTGCCKLPLSLMWETYLADNGGSNVKGRKPRLSYKISGFSAVGGLILLNFSPIVLMAIKTGHPPFLLWWILPVIGTAISLLFPFAMLKHYVRQFPGHSGSSMLRDHAIIPQKK